MPTTTMVGGVVGKIRFRRDLSENTAEHRSLGTLLLYPYSVPVLAPSLLRKSNSARVYRPRGPVVSCVTPLVLHLRFHLLWEPFFFLCTL